MIKNLSSALALCAVFAGAVSTAVADVSFGSKGKPSNDVPTVQSGVVVGFGNNQPLKRTLLQIVPGNYNIKYDTKVDQNMLVSWRGGRHWREVLAELSDNNDLNVMLTDHDVLISNKFDLIASDTHEIRYAPKRRLPTLIPQHGKQYGAGGLVEVQVIFKAKPGRTLRDTLQEWTKVSGWHLQWETNRTFSIEAEVQFTGNFESATAQLVQAFSSASPPVRARYFQTNKVLVIDTPSVNDELF